MVKTKSLLFSALAFGALFGQTHAAYRLRNTYSGQSFLDGFAHQGMHRDPTNGFVQYLDREEAANSGLIKLNGDGTVYIGVDHTNQAPNGRGSVRVQSRESFTQGLLIADIRHMPSSTCGVWPAFWLEPRAGTWPQRGEIDIIEGVNMQRYRRMVVHIGPQHCVMDPTPDLPFSRITRDDCYTIPSDPVGCSVSANAENTYGDGYNAVGGGYEAVLWTDTAITTWFFPRGGPVPPSLLSSSPDPNAFGTPLARWTFKQSGCDLPRLTRDQQIVFNIDLCGDWVNGVWGEQCAAETRYGTCKEFVSKHPEAFVDAFWTVGEVKWFESDKRKRDLMNETVPLNGTGLDY